MSFYARRASAFCPGDDEVAAVLTHHATIAFLNARKMAAKNRAIDTRTTIGQAEGILMHRLGIDADHAFSVLRQYSQRHNQPLRDVAREIVDLRNLPDPTRKLSNRTE